MREIRVGAAYQAVVPEWTGPPSAADDAAAMEVDAEAVDAAADDALPHATTATGTAAPAVGPPQRRWTPGAVDAGALAAWLRGIAERRATGRVLRVRASLARTAKLVIDNDPETLDGPLAPRGAADFWPQPESTGRGPALRLKPPVAIDGCAMRYDRPAVMLRSSAPSW